MSDFWNQLKSDVTGEVIEIPDVKDSAALGSAILAGIGTGIYSDVKDAVKKTVKIVRKYRPDRKINNQYKIILEKYESNYRIIENTF